jgi:hypothetical protein
MLGKWVRSRNLSHPRIVFFAVFLIAFFFFRSPTEAYLSSLCITGRQTDLQEGMGLGASLRDLGSGASRFHSSLSPPHGTFLCRLSKPLGILRGLSETAALRTVMLTGAFNAAAG